jgi:DNA-binding LytR/AlgR family response regulator
MILFLTSSFQNITHPILLQPNLVATPQSITIKRKRIILKKGKVFYPLSLKHIVFFHCKGVLVTAVDNRNRKFTCESNLIELEKLLSEELFFRINRQCIVNIQYIHSYKRTECNSLQLSIQIIHEHLFFLTSQKATPLFLKWIHQE